MIHGAEMLFQDGLYVTKMDSCSSQETIRPVWLAVCGEFAERTEGDLNPSYRIHYSHSYSIIIFFIRKENNKNAQA